MNEEPAIAFIEQLDYRNLSLLEIVEELKANEIKNAAGNDFFIAQVSDMLKQVNVKNNVSQKKSPKGCGIDRDSNPCGDASDY